LNFGDILEAYTDVKAYYEKMTEKQLDQETDRELETTLALCLFELKNLIGYDLKIDKHESQTAFWNFVGNPLYRMHEETIVERCRESDRYKEKLFEKCKQKSMNSEPTNPSDHHSFFSTNHRTVLSVTIK
jgi:hypothetical protein